MRKGVTIAEEIPVMTATAMIAAADAGQTMNERSHISSRSPSSDESRREISDCRTTICYTSTRSASKSREKEKQN